jgi:hypothetical protein
MNQINELELKFSQLLEAYNILQEYTDEILGSDSEDSDTLNYCKNITKNIINKVN